MAHSQGDELAINFARLEKVPERVWDATPAVYPFPNTAEFLRWSAHPYSVSSDPIRNDRADPSNIGWMLDDADSNLPSLRGPSCPSWRDPHAYGSTKENSQPANATTTVPAM